MTTTMGVVGLGGVLILSAATLAAVVLRRASASLRHRIWLAAVCAALALPFLEISGLEIRLPVPGVLDDALAELTAPPVGQSTEAAGWTAAPMPPSHDPVEPTSDRATDVVGAVCKLEDARPATQEILPSWA